MSNLSSYQPVEEFNRLIDGPGIGGGTRYPLATVPRNERLPPPTHSLALRAGIVAALALRAGIVAALRLRGWYLTMRLRFVPGIWNAIQESGKKMIGRKIVLTSPELVVRPVSVANLAVNSPGGKKKSIDRQE